MAQRKPIVIDGLVTEVREKSTVADVVPRDVTSVLTCDGQIVQREHFRRVPVPDGFETNLSPINKGAVYGRACATRTSVNRTSRGADR